jgi:hypothetical protein
MWQRTGLWFFGGEYEAGGIKNHMILLGWRILTIFFVVMTHWNIIKQNSSNQILKMHAVYVNYASINYFLKINN